MTCQFHTQRQRLCPVSATHCAQRPTFRGTWVVVACTMGPDGGPRRGEIPEFCAVHAADVAALRNRPPEETAQALRAQGGVKPITAKRRGRA